MSSFSIDEVRTSFTADVSTFLERIERRARALLEAQALHPAALDEERRCTSTTVGDVGHAIFGTTSHGGAGSLRESARALEELARAGDDALDRFERAATAARGIAEACIDGAARMRQMLANELEH